MRYNIKVTDFVITPAIKEYLEDKINRLDKFVNPEQKDLPMCYVEIGKTTKHHKNGEFFKAEFTIHIGGNSFRVEDEKEDLYTALDEVTEAMIERLKSFKNKKVSLIRRGGAKLKSIIRGLYGGK